MPPRVELLQGKSTGCAHWYSLLGHFRSVILYWGQFCLLRDIWQYLENFCLSQLGEKVLLVSGKQRAGMLLNVLQCTGRPSQQRTTWPQRSLVPRFRPCFRLYISFFHSEPLSAVCLPQVFEVTCSPLFPLLFSLYYEYITFLFLYYHFSTVSRRRDVKNVCGQSTVSTGRLKFITNVSWF